MKKQSEPIKYDLDVQQAADYLGRTPGWVHKAAQARLIPYTRVGKYLRFATSDLDAYMAANRREAVNA